MGYEITWEKSIPAEHGGVTYSASIRVHLHGKWSGNKTTGTPQSQSDRTFKLKITGSYTRATVPTQSGEMWTSDEWYCYQNDPNADGEVIYAICVDELYNKWVGNDTDGNLYLPFLRRARQRATESEDAEYYTACEEITETGSYPGAATDLILQYIAMAQTADMCLTSARLNPTAGLQWCYNIEYDIETDLPIFETEEQLMNYINSDGEDTSDIVNVDEPDPEEDYENQFKYHFVNNIFGHNTRNVTTYTGYRNYRFYPKSKRMCFYRVKATTSSPYTVRLMGYDSSVVVKSAPAYGSSDDDYTTISGAPELYYLHKSISFADNDYYTKFKFSTDLLVYGNESDAQDYIDGVGDPRLAENFNDVSRQYNEFIDPSYGSPDEGNDHGKNGINYSRGSTLWRLTEPEMHTFFGDIFNTANISDILSNTQLFGANQINSILGVAYYPFDVADVCRLDSSKKIYVGSWECPNATGKRVLFNYDLIDCGSISIPRVYNDYRDYEMEIYISLPYVGVHKLNTALYMGASSLHIYYAVDVSTGCCTAHLHVTNETLTDCEIDSWDGFISSMRPISAVDQQTYISGVMGNVTSIFNRETGMINDATQAVGSVMTGNVKGALSSGVGPGYGFSQSAGAIGDLYGLSQSIRDVPISTRGGFSGALGMFGNQKIHIITAQKRKTVPDNKLLTVGLPSNIGGRVGLFSGFLSVSAFTMADGFTGTAEELREIESIMSNGIFL